MRLANCSMRTNFLAFFTLLVLVTSSAWGQSNVAALLGHPELIIHNAKIVTMDSDSFGTEVGTIGEAMAVRGDSVLAVGTNAEIRALAGPQTRQMDLKGRTVLPSFIMTHEHPTDWAFAEPEAMKHALPADSDIMVMRWLEGTAQEQVDQWEEVLAEAVAEASPGQWVWMSFFWGANYEHAEGLWELFTEAVTLEKVDRIAPNNPVRIKNSWPLQSVNNTRALEELRKIHPEASLMGGDRFYEPNVIFEGRTRELADIIKAEMELWAAQGITAFGSSAYAHNNFLALSLLDRNGEMPARFAWGYTGPNFHIDTLRMVAGLVGSGSDYLWNIGAWGSAGGLCTSLNASPEVKAAETCSFEPDSPGRKVLDDIIRVGGRVATMHTGGDKDIDFYLDAIQKVSAEAGIPLEEIRKKRHAFDHASGAPRPDQIPTVKHFGMLVSMINTMLWENHRDYNTTARVRDYGIEYANLSVPRKSVNAAGIMNTFEIDRPLPHLVWTMIHKGITRYSDKMQRVLGPAERTDRIVQLRALTRWGGYYLLREDDLGTLERGKLADFIVLDRDYLTIPEDDIPNIKVLMTVVGGKTIHLMPGLAAEVGMQPAGPATWSTKPLENY